MICIDKEKVESEWKLLLAEIKEDRGPDILKIARMKGKIELLEDLALISEKDHKEAVKLANQKEGEIMINRLDEMSPESKKDVMINAINQFSAEDRLEIMASWCQHCGVEQEPGKPCQCWNDE